MFRREIEPRVEKLAPRERRVMELMVAGKPNKEVARELDLSVRTVEMRRRSVYEKMGAQSLPHLVRLIVHAEHDARPGIP